MMNENDDDDDDEYDEDGELIQKGGEGRGLHSSTFQLNLSAACGIGGALSGRLGAVQGVIRGC